MNKVLKDYFSLTQVNFEFHFRNTVTVVFDGDSYGLGIINKPSHRLLRRAPTSIIVTDESCRASLRPIKEYAK